MNSPKYLLLLAALILAACAPQAAGPCQDAESLAAVLEGQGAGVEVAEEIEQPFFTVPGQRLVVDGEDVQVFAYGRVEAAREEAGLVSPDGYSIGTSMVSWVATPHFFQCGQLIVLYVGEEAGVLGLLQAVLGAQFAGG